MDKKAATWFHRQLGNFRGDICEEFPIHMQETRAIEVTN
jgi:hypothetical protein